MLNRRKFVASGVAAGVAAGFAPGMAFAAERADVIVIGAGLSGLNTAMILKEQGYKVLVLDANTRIGGWVLTVDTVDGKTDVGASQIGRGYARVLDMVQKLGLKLIPEDRDLLTFGSYFRETWIDNKTWESNPLNKTVGEERRIAPMMMGSALMAKYNPLAEVDEWLDPKYAQYDISLRELLRRKGHSDAAIELAQYSAPGISIDATSVLRMWQEDTRGKIDRKLAATAAPGHRDHPFGEANDRNLIDGLAMINNIEGGCQKLPLAMAGTLGDVIHLNKKVARIDMTNRSGTVRCTDGSEFTGRFIVSAIPFTMLRDVAISGPGGLYQRKAIATMPYANTARLYMTVEKPFWKEDGLPPSFSTDGPIGMFWAIDNHTGEGRHRAMVVMVGQVAAAMSSRDRPAAETFIMDELARLRPASKGLIRLDTYKDWARDPLQKGCGFSLAPGQVNGFARRMNDPWAVLHFAGEHTRRLDIGMESAMESGERAALEIVGRG